MERCAAVKREAGLDDVKMVLITNASMFHRPHVQRGLGDSRPQQRRDLGQARRGNRRVLSPHRADADPVPADSGQYHGGGAGAAAGDPVALHASEWRTAVTGGAGGILRSAQRDHGGRRHAEAGADLHDRAAAGGVVRRAAGGRGGRCDCGVGEASAQDSTRSGITAARIIEMSATLLRCSPFPRREAVVLLVLEVAAVVDAVLHHRVDEPAVVGVLELERLAAEGIDRRFFRQRKSVQAARLAAVLVAVLRECVGDSSARGSLARLRH